MADTQLQAVLAAYATSAPGATANGDDAKIIAQDGGATSGAGGDVLIQAGDTVAGGIGGDIQVSAGNSGDSAGGSVFIEAGEGDGGSGGELQLQSGNSQDGTGGLLTVRAGSGTDAGGTTEIRGGSALAASAGNGGDVVIIPGEADGAGVAGHARIEGLQNFADDAAAAIGGVPVGGLYRTLSAVMVRVA